MASKPPSAIAWLFPGQGSQVVGMGHDLFAQSAQARAVLHRAGETIGTDLATLVARGPDEALTRTDNLQPALTAVTIVCCLALQDEGMQPDFVAGHSLGEYAALFAAGVIGLDDTLKLVAARGRLMHAIAQTLDGGMLAVGDLPADQVETVLQSLPDPGAVTIANHNAATQVAVCGARSVLDAAAAALGAAGGRVTALNVSGPWHSPLLAPAADQFAELLDATPFHDARVPVAMNTTGALARSASDIRAAMRRQLCSPVRWHAAMLALHDAGVDRFVELGPKKVLRGLLRHIPAVAACGAANFDGPRALRFVQRLYTMAPA
jgi:[acyl-carrier-protein] S-malonyltransferase